MIHTAKHISSDAKTTPLFRLKGLPNLAPATISSLDIHGVALRRQVAFSQYADNITHFLAATSKGERLRIDGEPLGRLSVTGTNVPLAHPVVKFALLKDLPTQKVDKFVSTLGPGASSEVVGRTRVYTMKTMPKGMLAKLKVIASRDFNAGPDFVNIRGYEAYLLINRLIDLFLRVHTYTAKFEPLPEESLVAIQSLDTTHPDFIRAHGEIMKTLKPQEQQVGEDEAMNLAGETPVATDDATEHIDVTDYSVAVEEGALINGSDEYEDEVSALGVHIGVYSTAGIDSVAWAKPSPVPNSEINRGPPGSVPEESGILFPYFCGLVEPDPKILREFVCRRAFLLLGNTTEECQANYLEYRRGIASLATTQVGMELTHMITGINLALQTQGRCFMLLDRKEYSGFVLLGHEFCVFDTKQWILPDKENLRESLLNIDPHAKSVKELCRLFVGWRVKGAYSGDALSEDDFDHPVRIAAAFEKLDITQLEKEDLTYGNQLARCLNYQGDGFKPMDPIVVAEQIALLFSDAPIQLSPPTYFPDMTSVNTGREFAIMSRFGPESFSLWNDRGSLFECKPVQITSVVTNNKRKREQKEEDKFANMPDRILITPKPLQIALNDWKKVVDKGSIRIDLKERAGKFRNVNVVSEMSRKKIWGALCDGLGEVETRPRKKTKGNDEPKDAEYDDVMSALLGSL